MLRKNNAHGFVNRVNGEKKIVSKLCFLSHLFLFGSFPKKALTKNLFYEIGVFSLNIGLQILGLHWIDLKTNRPSKKLPEGRCIHDTNRYTSIQIVLLKLLCKSIFPRNDCFHWKKCRCHWLSCHDNCFGKNYIKLGWSNCPTKISLQVNIFPYRLLPLKKMQASLAILPW